MTTTGTCIQREMNLIIVDTDPEMDAVKDYLVADLAKIGITLNVEVLPKEEYIAKETNGDFNMLFSRTWGAPYDPHSYFNSWEVPSHVEYSVLEGLEAPLTRDGLLAKIDDVQTTSDTMEVQTKWSEILNDVHQQAIFAPLWGTRIPYVVNRRLSGFRPSDQTYSYPLSTVSVLEGEKIVTVAPGAGGAIFSQIGPIHPHQYYPNQLFSQAWVYEGLVSYGQDGEITPALAKSWEVVGDATGTQTATFTLREGVKFHDGTDFNCTVAKLNFDHILHDSVKERHAWCGTTQKLTSWECNEDGQFILKTDTEFYPLLQELTYIRPMTIVSAGAFANGVDSDPLLENSCNSGEFGSKYDYLEDTVTCAGLNGPYGSGPFKYVTKETNADGIDTKVVFAKHDEYWGAEPGIEELHVVYYEDTDAVEKALMDESLDMALGIGPLTALQVQNLKFYHSDKVDVRHSDIQQHSVLVMNTNMAPTDDIDVRKAVIHAIDKAEFVEKEFAGLEKSVYQTMPDAAPYCDIDLNPKWNYDLEKATFLNCPLESSSSSSSSELSDGAIAGIAIGGIALVVLAMFTYNLISREKSGAPIFSPKKLDVEAV